MAAAGQPRGGARGDQAEGFKKRERRGFGADAVSRHLCGAVVGPCRGSWNDGHF